MPVLEGVNPRPIEGVELVGHDEAATKSDPAHSSSEIGANENRVCQTDSSSTNEGNDKRVTAKSQLLKLCIAKKWKLPLYECCKEEGPPHLRMFTFKVIVEIEEASKTVLECFSDPHLKKKAAAEHAAEAAVWYLKNVGHYSKDR